MHFICTWCTGLFPAPSSETSWEEFSLWAVSLKIFCLCIDVTFWYILEDCSHSYLDPRQEQGAFPVTPERLGKLGSQSKFRTSGLTELELTEFDRLWTNVIIIAYVDHFCIDRSMAKKGWHKWILIWCVWSQGQSISESAFRCFEVFWSAFRSHLETNRNH